MQLNIYPVKSCRAVSLTEATSAKTGLAYDRSWMVVDHESNFVTQRELPRLALVDVALDDDVLRLAAPGMGSLEISKDIKGDVRNCELFGELCRARNTTSDATDWFSSFLGGQYSLVTIDPDFHRPGGVQYASRDKTPTSFVENFGILIVSQASFNDVNERLEPSAVPGNRFRANIVIDGIEAFDEEYAESFLIGDVHLRSVAVCTRCTMTNFDQSTGNVGQEPFKTLSAYRYDETWKGIRFGAYAAVASGFGNKIRVGDELSLKLAF